MEIKHCADLRIKIRRLMKAKPQIVFINFLRSIIYYEYDNRIKLYV
jgi:hypothetical protein